MDDRDAEIARAGRERTGAVGVHDLGDVGLDFRSLAVGIGGGAHQHVWPCRSNRGRDRTRVGQIEIGPAHGDDLDTALAPGFDQRPCNLAFGSGDDNAHGGHHAG